MTLCAHIAAGCIATLVLVPLRSPAQNNKPKADAKDCSKAAKILEKGHPEKKEAWALDYLGVCGKLGADALVAAIPRQMNVTDTLALESFFSTVDNWRDGAIMAAALDLALNPGASVQARVFSIRHLVVLVDRNVTFLYGDISASPRTVTTDEGTTFIPACGAARGSELPNNAATPLPPSYVSIIKAAMANIASTSSTPVPVRNAAACAQW